MSETKCPLVRFHVERAGKFFAYDRHGDEDEFWVDYGTPFVCDWDNPEAAAKAANESGMAGYVIRGSEQMSSRAFPLQWPDGWPRTPSHKRGRSPYKVTPDRALNEMLNGLKLLGALRGSVIVSTNVPLRNDGLPYANVRRPEDTGVAVYWATRTHGERVVACDRWTEVHENIRAIGLAIDGLRAVDRAGASQILERAFTAFGALPAPEAAPVVRPWWEVFGFAQSMLGALSLGVIEARYRELAPAAHPDRGGTQAAIVELNGARDAARRHYGGG